MGKDELHIIHLLEWIEDNLEKKLDASAISSKSGYTKWHLQKMFKSCTGLTMLEYVRSRRLCKAAIELKFSSKSIIDIVRKYKFDSQSSFTRVFKNKYGISPGKFRDKRELPFGDLVYKYSPQLDKYNIEGEYVYYDHLVLYGVQQQYLCPIHEIKKPHRIYRKKLRNDFIEHNSIQAKEVFSLGRFIAYDDNNALCSYHLGVSTAQHGLTSLPVITGDFIKFDYVGDEDGIYEFVLSIYFVKFRTHYVVRRDYYDIEIFNYLNDGKIKYSYLIPIVFDTVTIPSLFCG